MDAVSPVPTMYRFQENGWNFTQELDLLLTRRHLSRIKAAEYIGPEHAFLSRLCYGTKRPSRDVVKQIANRLDLDSKEEARLMVLAGFVPDHFTDFLLQQIDWWTLSPPDREITQ